MALQSSQRLPELQFYTKKSYRILQFQFYKGTHTTSIHIHRSREFSIQNPILHAEDKELFEYYYYIQRAKRPSFQKRNSTYRRQGDLLEIHPCVLQDLPKAFQAFQPQDLPKAFQTFPKGIPDIPVVPDLPVFPNIPVVPDLPVISDIPVIHDLPASPGNSTSSSISKESTPFQHSPIRMHILHILQVLQFNWFPQKTPPSTSWTIQTTNILQTLHSSKKGRCCDIGQNVSVKMSRWHFLRIRIISFRCLVKWKD